MTAAAAYPGAGGMMGDPASADPRGPLYWLCVETRLGLCGLAWSAQGLVGSQLPEATRGETRDRMRQRFPSAQRCAEGDAVPAFVADAMVQLKALMAGEPAPGLATLPLDERGLSPFQTALYLLARQIPQGQTRSYGELAALLKSPHAARAVGQAMGLNPFAPIVPCHRVLPGRGSRAGLGGFSAHGGAITKEKLLRLEARATGQWAGQQGELDLD
ncbi:methylated-DNA--[protein]-cysteine S-methyltransferase [Pelomonas sp. CA6]|uniref:methylated-DNA--[protein]-cysteine S-methyltransferase n=1 Tax=Pelomonas sp. CA6 TaxID=2907999 RepID=UPI001F4C047C|nr:methylated-DNA--[protein]-cysteine S-methyltransferase [Pelomonas sp. CA6]MCH7344942.1 methylated-DNA--[protein]-cysteine S-methyltransferase [Pelomonas sp. CA6]